MTQDTLERGTPDWWLARLEKRRSDEQPDLVRQRALYDGSMQLKALQRWWIELFGENTPRLVDNFAELVIDVTAERIVPEGFRFGQTLGGDETAWATWQANDLDEFSQDATVDALIHGRCPVIVAPGEEGEPAVISVESPFQVTVEYKPGPGRVPAAALKVWDDAVAGRRYATLYLPSGTYRYEAVDEQMFDVSGARKSGWTRRAGAEYFTANQFGDQVPVVEIRNRRGKSDVDPVYGTQLAIEKTFVDMLVASEFAAAPQRFLIGVEPEEDDDGNVDPTWKEKMGVERIISLVAGDGDNGRVDVKQLDAADLGNYVKALEALVQHLAARTRVPTHYLLGQSGTFPTGESTRAVETGLVAKARQRMVSMGSGWERVMKLAARIEGDAERASMVCETVWRDPEYRTEGERVDALVKMSTLGIPMKVLWQRWGATDEEIRTWDQYAMQDALRQALAMGVDATSGAPVDVSAVSAGS